MSNSMQPSRTPRSVLAALDFASPLAYAFRVPTPAEAEPAQEQIETIWNGSIIQMQNGDWLQFAGMDWSSRNVLDSLVLYSRDGESSEPKARPIWRGPRCRHYWTWQHENACLQKDNPRLPRRNVQR